MDNSKNATGNNCAIGHDPQAECWRVLDIHEWEGIEAEVMATNVVNLDALIPREDFAVKDKGEDFKRGDTFRITDLVPGAFTYAALRKPDFQRETANWSPQKIQDFVQTFLSGDLVPAIILWGAGGEVFVIDGAHRLSALIAWVHDDYGDGKISREFFDNNIPPEQLKAADRTRTLIRKSIGTYIEHEAAKPTSNSRPEVKERALRMSSLALQLQWVPSTDAKRAEASFFKINQAFTEIDPTELRILSARTQPNAIAARAIVRSATGHKYWATFADDVQAEIEVLAKEIYGILFTPPLDTPIKTMDVPVAGRGYSAYTLPLIFELVNLANGVPIVDAKRSAKSVPKLAQEPAPDDGSKTLQFLKNTRKLVWRISGVHSSSLGLHPLVYFYSGTGRYQPTAFLAGAAFVFELDRKNEFADFAKVRKRFEDFFINHKNFINQSVVKFGSMAKGYAHIRDLYLAVMGALVNGRSDDAIVKILQGTDRFAFLSTVIPEAASKNKDGDFSRDTKSAAFLREALGNPPVRCHLCQGLMHKNSMHIDHKQRKQDGGGGKLDNAAIAHPYCDSTLKENAYAKAIR